MSTSLILRPVGDMTETQAAMLAELDREGDAGFEFQPLRIKFPTGGATGAFVLSDGDMLKAPVEMIVAVAQRARAYWPGKETLGQPPLCGSPDALLGHFDPTSQQTKEAAAAPVRHPALNELDPAQAAGPWQCDSCPLAQWESAGNGRRGQACKSMRRLLVIVRGWSMPAVLTLPPTSVKAWDGFASGLRQRGQSYFGRWLTMELNAAKNAGGTPYAVINIKSGAVLSDPEAAEVMALRARFAELVRTMDIVAEDYDTEGDAVPHSSNEPVIDGASVEEPPF